MAMKRTTILYVTLAIGLALSAGADDVLDAKLNALKTKTQQRTYSTRALLNDQNFIVPKAATDEEKALDAKIMAMDKQPDQVPTVLARPSLPSPYIPRPEQEEPVNWLTPALFDDAAAKNNSSDEDGDSWIAMELLRQKNIKLGEVEPADGQVMFNQQPWSEMPNGSVTSYNPLKGYNDSLPNIYSSDLTTPTTWQASTEDSGFIYDRDQTPELNTLRSDPDSTSTQPDSWLSRSIDSGVSSASTLPERFLPFGKTQVPSWTTPDSETPAPSKRIRRTLPTPTENPFEEDLMPIIKTSIWD